jgi:cell division protein ZapA
LEKPIKVKLLDREYLIKSNEGEEGVQTIARYVSKKFNQISENTGGLSEKKIAILAAFNIAGDYFQLLKKRDELVETIERRARALNSHIDSVTRHDKNP